MRQAIQGQHLLLVIVVVNDKQDVVSQQGCRQGLRSLCQEVTTRGDKVGTTMSHQALLPTRKSLAVQKLSQSVAPSQGANHTPLPIFPSGLVGGGSGAACIGLGSYQTLHAPSEHSMGMNMCDATVSGGLGEKIGVCVPNFLQRTWEWVSIQKMSKRQEQQSNSGLPITICIYDKNRFRTSLERDERGHLNIIEEKSADHTCKASPQCGNVLCSLERAGLVWSGQSEHGKNVGRQGELTGKVRGQVPLGRRKEVKW